MNRGKRSRHTCAIAAALAQATLAQSQVTRSSRAKSMPKGAAQATPAQPQVTRSSRADNMPEVATNARPMDPTWIASSSGQPDQVFESTYGRPSASGEGSCRVRGKTRGMKVVKLRKQLDHAIPISIPASSHAPKGEFATTFANLLGEAIRDEAPVQKEGWKFVPEGIKKLVVKRVQEKSKKARVSRSKMPWNHTSGSRSFLAHSSIIRAQNAGHAQPFPDFYHGTHYMHRKNKWINEEAQETHEELVRVTTEQSQPSITSPMTEEYISVKVAEFSKRTIFLEGLVVQLAERVGIDPDITIGGDGTSGEAQDATSLDLYMTTLFKMCVCACVRKRVYVDECASSVVTVPDPRLDSSYHEAADQVLSSLLDFNPSMWGLPPFQDVES
ncbi:DL-glycerol-3-phosphatase 2 [Cinnamomum micranthum f. kanehirae]|uniref:DL-glycerol-3-phosphatase 2 n=1 Tax=Cinnamomum micranthum f. kanehirae TaxID=337451 RepID=A0A3S3NHS0_9MAGN|nr:DL-glycerol-3-phosphatase 2 [Cinnamomum micranthum f. kanehirae]